MLKAVAGSPAGLPLTELARSAGLSKATASRILKTLVAEELVDFHDEAARYVVGDALVRMAIGHRMQAKVAAADDLARLGAPEMRALCEATGETVALVMHHGDVRTNVAVTLGSHELIAAPKVGAQLPLHTGGPGKVILAHLPEAEVDAFLQRSRLRALTANSISSAASLKRELTAIREHGYATSDGEAVEGQNSVAAPIFRRGEIVAALNLITPTARFSAERQRDFVPLVREAARQITRLADRSADHHTGADR